MIVSRPNPRSQSENATRPRMHRGDRCAFGCVDEDALPFQQAARAVVTETVREFAGRRPRQFAFGARERRGFARVARGAAVRRPALRGVCGLRSAATSVQICPASASSGRRAGVRGRDVSNAVRRVRCRGCSASPRGPVSRRRVAAAFASISVEGLLILRQRFGTRRRKIAVIVDHPVELLADPAGSAAASGNPHPTDDMPPRGDLRSAWPVRRALSFSVVIWSFRSASSFAICFSSRLDLADVAAGCGNRLVGCAQFRLQIALPPRCVGKPCVEVVEASW